MASEYYSRGRPIDDPDDLLHKVVGVIIVVVVVVRLEGVVKEEVSCKWNDRWVSQCIKHRVYIGHNTKSTIASIGSLGSLGLGLDCQIKNCHRQLEARVHNER